MRAIYKKNEYTNSKKAFTLVETLVAIAILLVAVVEPLSIVSSSVATANLAKDQVTAFYLAQEGIELVKNKRDTNVSTLGDWLAGSQEDLTLCKNKYCYIDPNNVSPGVTQCTTVSDPKTCKNLYKVLDGNVFRYGYNDSPPAVPTTFIRAIKIEETIPGIEAIVTVKMFWQTGSLYGVGSIERTFEIKEAIYNWSS